MLFVISSFPFVLLAIMSDRFVLSEYRCSSYVVYIAHLTCNCNFYVVHTREMRDDKIQFRMKNHKETSFYSWDPRKNRTKFKYDI